MKFKYLILFNFFVLPSSYGADSLGRLFFTPEQRAQLDVARARRDQRLPVSSEAQTVTPPPAPSGPNVVTYNGMVLRSDGKSTVWINGKPVNERNRLGGPSDVNVVGMRDDGAVAVAIPQASRTASLKVGQRLDVNSGRIEEPYAQREALTHAGESAAPRTSLATQPHSEAMTSPRSLESTLKMLRTFRENVFRETDPASSAGVPERATKK